MHYWTSRKYWCDVLLLIIVEKIILSEKKNLNWVLDTKLDDNLYLQPLVILLHNCSYAQVNVTLSSILTLKWHKVPKEPTKVRQNLEELRVSYWQHLPIEKNIIIIRNKRLYTVQI